MMINEREMKRRAAMRQARRRRAIKARFMLAGMIAAIILLAVGVVSVINNAKAADTQVAEETYIPQHDGKFETFRYEVKGGESLGIIAARFIQQYNSDDAVDTVVDRIINYTGLDRTEATYHLQAGQMITVALWTNVKEELN